MRVVILAGGQGKRMRSALPKPLHPLCGRPLIRWAMEIARPLDPRPVVVVGHGREQVMAALGGDADFAVQDPPRGTGHAVLAALPAIEREDRVLVMAGDMPLLQSDSLIALMNALGSGAAAAVLTARVEDPTGYGRVVRNGCGAVEAIVEQRDADEATARIDEINTSVYAFDGAALRAGLQSLTCDNAQGEYYLTDVISALTRAGTRVAAVACPADESLGINDRAQLAAAAAVLRRRINGGHMAAGVTLTDPEAVYIDADVVIGEDTVIHPGSVLEAGTRIGRGCTLYGNNRLKASELGDGVTVESSVLLSARVGDGSTVGPNAYLRPGSDIGPGCRIGDFVEIKNSHIGGDTKISHLSYVGDADVGAGVNIGCGTVFVNYDGLRKHRTTVGDGAFIGCNTNLVAPVTVGEGAYTAAGSTITEDVPAGALAIGRSRQVVKPGWADRRKK